MTMTTTADIKAAMAGPPLEITRQPASSGAFFASAWVSSVSWPPSGAIPSSGVAGDVPTKATTGAFQFPDSGAGASTYIATMDLVLGTAARGTIVMLYDRLWHNSGLSVTTTGAQTVGSVALPSRANGGVDCELWLDSYASMGAGTPTITCTYTNSAGTGSRVATLQGLATAANNSRCFPFALDAGDMGVQAVADFNMTATRTSGTHGLVIRRRIATFTAGTFNIRRHGFLNNTLPLIADDACLELIVLGTCGLIHGSLQLAQG